MGAPVARQRTTGVPSAGQFRRSAAGIRDDFSAPGQTLQLGLPPRRIDVLTEIDGVTFETAWPDRLRGRLGSVEASFLGRAALLANKRAAGRAKDLADVELLSQKGDRS